MSHTARVIFRVVGQLVEGTLSVEYVRHCDLPPETAPLLGGKIISTVDTLWIDKVQLELVNIIDRLPNTLLRVTVRNQTEVVKVERPS
ncbi:MAG TPA: hypothetical protein VEC99_16620 [Clostridia bacterium]|nr:hypothetical protein [Clostridia bacterium]